MPGYKVEITARAQKQLESLDKPIRNRVVAAIDVLEENPRPPADRRLVGRPAYRIRVGDYRVIYEVEHEMLMIVVVDVGHRSQIYG